MNCRVVCCAIIAFAPCAGLQTLRAGEDKVYEVGNSGLTLEGKIAADDPTVKLLIGDKSQSLPAKLFQVRLIGGKKYRVSLDSKEIDSLLMLRDAAGRQMDWDDNSGGDLNSLLKLNIFLNGTYKIFAASRKGSGNFTLKVHEDGVIKVHEVGAGLRFTGETGQKQSVAYNLRFFADKTYVIDLINPNPMALAPNLRLLDVAGNLLNEDLGGGLNARMIHKFERAGTYHVVLTSFANDRGPYTLTVRDARDGERAWTGEEKEKIKRAVQLNARALALNREGKTAEGIKLAQEAMALCKEVLGEKHRNYAAILTNLGTLYNSQSNYSKGEPLFRQAREIYKEVIGEKHPDYATNQSGLGAVYHSQGNYAKAEHLFYEATEIYREFLGEKHPDYATSLNDLALMYKSQGNYAKAELLYRQALEIRKEVLGEKHPDYATSLNNMACLYDAQGDYVKAEPLYRKALDIRKQVLWDKHPHFAESLECLGHICETHGNYAKAETLYLHALKITKESLGEKHRNYAKYLNSLAVLYSHRNYEKAEPLYRKALEINKEMLGEKHPNYATSLNNLAWLYHEHGDYAKAEPLYLHALEIRKEVLGVKHPDYANSLNNLAGLYVWQGDNAKAEPLLRQSLEIKKKVLGEKHPDYARSLNNLAVLYKDQGDYAQADPLSRQAILATLATKAPMAMEDVQPDDLRVHAQTVWILQSHALLLHETTGNGASSKERRSCDRFFSLALAVLDRVREDYRDSQEGKTWLTAQKLACFRAESGLCRSFSHLRGAIKTSKLLIGLPSKEPLAPFSKRWE